MLTRLFQQAQPKLFYYKKSQKLIQVGQVSFLNNNVEREANDVYGVNLKL